MFKGGSCLKKCYFGEYRFSEDLDFTTLEGAPQGQALEDAFSRVCRQAEGLLKSVGEVRLICTRYEEKQAHPHGQEAFVIRGQLPWHSGPLTKMMIEITTGEAVLCQPLERPLLHEYGEEVSGSLAVYDLKEIIAEKLRAVLQQVAKLEQRGWIRPRPRDYYDLWRILNTYAELREIPDFSTFLHAKCTPKGVDFTGPESFFPETMMKSIEHVWASWMGPLVVGLPEWATVRDELYPMIRQLVDSSSATDPA